MSTFTAKEKERIFVERTRDLWPATWALYEKLVSHETWSRDQLRDYNWKRRMQILAWAYDNSPFYRRLYQENGIHPSDVKSEADWNCLPIITKEDLREFGDDILVPSQKQYLRKNMTSGSTGIPLTLYGDQRAYSPASGWLIRGWHCDRPKGEPLCREQAVLGIDEVLLRRGKNFKSASYLQMCWPQRYFVLDSQQMGDEAIAAWYNEAGNAVRNGEFHMEGYTDAMLDFVEWAVRKGVEIKRPLTLNVGGAVLHKSACERIEQIMGVRLSEVYGANETSSIASTCSGKMGKIHHCHVLSDLKQIDLVDDGGNPVPEGTEGWTVVTVFDNFVAPLIRYRLGDWTGYDVEPCDCGLPYPTLHHIAGRESCYLVDNRGNKVHAPSNLFTADTGLVLRFQYHQLEPGRVCLWVVLDRSREGAERCCGEIRRELQEKLDGRIDFEVKVVDHIPVRDGKLSYTVYDG